MKKLLGIAVSIAVLAAAIFFLLKWIDPSPPVTETPSCVGEGCVS